jgi:hypothetical protein
MVTDTSQIGFERAAFNSFTLGSQRPVWVEGHAIAAAQRIPAPEPAFSPNHERWSRSWPLPGFPQGGAGVGMLLKLSRCMSE